MSEINHPLETILRLCEAAAPEPWYPKLHAEQNGVDRASLDPPLDRLRLGGWLQLTDWMEGKGQGYRLTDQGRELLKNSQAMAEVRLGQLPPAALAPSVATVDTPATAWDRGEAVREAFLGAHAPTATFAFIAICVLIFMAERLTPEDGPLDQLLRRGRVIFWPYIIEGQWWRLLTHAFFHGSPTHLIMNMLALLALGREAERLWGRGRFIILYFLSALGGGVAVLLFTEHGALGASGAICGLFAASAVWLWRNYAYLPPTFVDAWKRNLLTNAILIGVISFWPGVSAAGHAGGAVAGALAAFLLDWQRFGNRWQRRLAYLGLAALPLLAIGSILVKEQMDPRWRELSTSLQVEELLSDALALYQDEIEPALVNRDLASIAQAQAAIAQLRERAERLRVSLGERPWWLRQVIYLFCQAADEALRDKQPEATKKLQHFIGEMRALEQQLAERFNR